MTSRLRTIALSAAGPSSVEVANFRVCFSRRFPAASAISNSASLRAPNFVSVSMVNLRLVAMAPHKSSLGRAVDLGYTTPVMSGRLAERETAMHYEANEQPHSQIWLELDESERIDAVMDYHRRTRVKLENPELHAIAHVVVENQVALGEATSVPATLDRLMDEGLDRHEAIHAIASILMSIVSDIAREADDGSDINAKYDRELGKLTAAGWRSQAE